ncbi:MAG: hypothetical protein GY896_16905 [Gammaproteobacteria bacterium]|nr:hypothetical protein [Gammaproteobacteria bacterium]
MAKANPRQRVVLHLDPRIALEAIILNRHERIPQARRQEWLRGLLLQGFRIECQALRATSSGTTPGLITRTNSFSPGIKRTPICTVDPEPAVVGMTPSHVDTAEKPFAALGKVIG